MSIVLLLHMMRVGGGWLIYISGWVGRQMVGIILLFLFFSCAFLFCCLTFSVPLIRWLEHDGSCVSFFVFFLIFCLLPLTRIY